MNKINKLLIYCSGSDWKILERSPKKELQKSKAMGITNLSIFSYGFICYLALFIRASNNNYSYLIIGSFLSIFIFFINRFFLSYRVKDNADTRTKILRYLPIITLFILIGLLVSKPLEVILLREYIVSETDSNELPNLFESLEIIYSIAKKSNVVFYCIVFINILFATLFTSIILLDVLVPVGVYDSTVHLKLIEEEHNLKSELEMEKNLIVKQFNIEIESLAKQVHEYKRAVIKRKKENPPTQNGKVYLFVIGINNYLNYNRLYNAVEDAKAVVEVIKDRYIVDEVVSLYDNTATRNKILGVFEELEAQITSKDSLIVFYSGHGYYHKPIGYIIPSDAPDNSKVGFISNSTLVDQFKTIKAHHILLILDSCFSGSLLVSRDISTKLVSDKVENYADRALKKRSRYAVAAGNIELVSDGIAGNHSPFTRALINSLRNNVYQKFPISYLFQEVREITSYNSKQTPVGGALRNLTDSVGGEFVFQLNQ